MKKQWSMMLIVSLVLCLFAGCGTGTKTAENGAIVNKEQYENIMTTVSGEEVEITNSFIALGATDYGYAMVAPQTWKDIPKENLYLARDDNICLASYVPQAVVDQLKEMAKTEMSEAEIVQANKLLGESLVPFAALCGVKEGEKAKSTLLEDYHQSETIATVNGYHYALYYNETFDTEGLSDTDKERLNILAQSVEDMKKNVMLFPPKIEEGGHFEGSLEQFNAKDMKGKAVDQSIFADYDLTMVNIWTTWCGYCVEEMEGLEQLYQKLPDHVNMISICVDADAEKELATQILSDKGASFQTLIGNEDLQKTLLQYVSGYPTTIFVDHNGKVVGSIQQGAPGKDVVTGYQALIEDHLTLVNHDKGEAAWLKEQEKQ